MPNELLSTAKAAEALSVDRSTLTRMVQAGKVKPAVKGDGLRGAMFFYPSEIRKAKARILAESAVVRENAEQAS
jgi:predicted site-specific integrase-resolvase